METLLGVLAGALVAAGGVARLVIPEVNIRAYLVEIGGIAIDRLYARFARRHPQLGPFRKRGGGCGAERAGGTGETGADDDHVEVETLACVVHAASGRWNAGHDAPPARTGDGATVKRA